MSRIYDVFIFNNEIDLLLLRLEYLYHEVDYFVILESSQTFSRNKKNLHFKESRQKFDAFLEKIIHVEIPEIDLENPWKIEFYQRSYFVHAELNLNLDDLIIVSDIDEIPNIEKVKEYWLHTHTPAILETNMFYYGLNLKMDQYCNRGGRPIIGTYDFYKNNDFGSRIKYRTQKLLPLLGSKGNPYAWHFSFCFGTNYKLYSEKLESYSHIEYNIPKLKNAKNIRVCVQLGEDILRRTWAWGKFIDVDKEFPVTFIRAVGKLNFESYILKTPSYFDYLSWIYVEIKFNRLLYFAKLKWTYLKIKVNKILNA